MISERELVGFLCFQREPDFGLWFLLETFVCVCVFFVKRNRFCCCVFAVFSETDFWLCVCFCVFFFPLKQILGCCCWRDFVVGLCCFGVVGLLFCWDC